MLNYSSVSSYYKRLDDEEPRKCTERQLRFLERARRMAMKSNMAHRHGCVIVLDDEVIATGYNHFFTHYCHKFSIHAEVDALMKVKKRWRHLLPTCELYVVRVGPPSMDCCFKYSRPCDECTRCITKMGLRKVFYSTNFDYDAHVLGNTEKIDSST